MRRATLPYFETLDGHQELYLVKTIGSGFSGRHDSTYWSQTEKELVTFSNAEDTRAMGINFIEFFKQFLTDGLVREVADINLQKELFPESGRPVYLTKTHNLRVDFKDKAITNLIEECRAADKAPQSCGICELGMWGSGTNTQSFINEEMIRE